MEAKSAKYMQKSDKNREEKDAWGVIIGYI
jgi:hypothetical protein